MDMEQFKSYLIDEEKKAFKGWDFSYIDGRCVSDDLPWYYREIVLKHLKPSDKLLDLGTGGGEFLLSLNHPYNLTSVTESYPPNVQLCYDKLSPLGIEVKQTFDDNKLPFDDSTFDIVISRHESFDAVEVNRVLKSGGFFITQQVGGSNNTDLSKKLIDNYIPNCPEHDLIHNRELLIKENFDILFEDEVYNQTKFYDMGALVYYAKIIEWEFPGFSVDTHFENLCEIQNEMIDNGYVSGTQHRFIVVAKKK